MTALEAARLGDQIGHTSAMKGLLAGLVAGFVITGLVLLAAGATVATGGAAAVVIGALIAGTCAGGLTGMKLGATFDSDPMGPINTGSPDTFLGPAGRPAARAIIDTVLCEDHQIKPIAQGSLNVFINKQPAARHTDATVCSAKIREGQPDVFFGGPTGTYLEMESEVPGWLVTTLQIGVWVGAAIATGGAIFTVGLAGALGGLAGGIAGGWVGGKIGGAIGGLFGERGAIIGEAVGSFIGGMAGGMMGAKVANETVAAMPGESQMHIDARTQVAQDFYAKNGTTYDANLNGPGAGGVRPMTPAEINSAMRGIDMTKPVEVVDAPSQLGQWQSPGGHQGDYYADPSTTPNELGIGDYGKGAFKDNTLYQMEPGTQALKSTSGPITDNWSTTGLDQPTTGGGTQYYMPNKGAATPIAGSTRPMTPGEMNPGGPPPGMSSTMPTAPPATAGPPPITTNTAIPNPGPGGSSSSGGSWTSRIFGGGP